MKIECIDQQFAVLKMVYLTEFSAVVTAATVLVGVRYYVLDIGRQAGLRQAG
jgi:hypothetical protein